MAIRVCSGCGEAKSDDNFKVVHRRNRTERLTVCKACDKKYHREWYQNNREKVLMCSREHYAQHAEQHKEQGRARYWANPQKHHALVRACAGRKLGFTPELETELREYQRGACATCGVAFKDQRSTHRDHDHTTGQPRGLLCSTCNICLGYYEKHLKPRGIITPAFDAYLDSPPTKRLRKT